MPFPEKVGCLYSQVSYKDEYHSELYQKMGYSLLIYCLDVCFHSLLVVVLLQCFLFCSMRMGYRIADPLCFESDVNEVLYFFMFSRQIVFRIRLLFLNTACKIVILDIYKLILFHGMFESVLK